MKWQLAWLKARRAVFRGRVRGTPLADCWADATLVGGRDWRHVAFLVCDAEMSSLDPAEGELLSLGWVAIDNAMLQLCSATHCLIRPTVSVGQSATIHNLRDIDVAGARSLEDGMLQFLEAARGRVLVFHHAALDIAYLDAACKQLYGAPLLMPYVDTLTTEHRLLARRTGAVADGELRLQACRDRYNLPGAPAHNALQDAVATAELLLAQASKRAGKGKLPLNDMLG